MTATKKALVLSGGGGRGAYHVGAIQALVERGWMADGRGPDIIAGTSIGAINAAALASGLTADQLKQRWLHMHTEDVHRLSADLPAVTRPFLHFLLGDILTSKAHDRDRETIPDQEGELSEQGLLSRLTSLFQSRPFRSLLDTAPWRRTLAGWMDFERINGPAAPALLLAATELQTGALRVFCNRELNGRPADLIALDHLMASSSIPIVYPWTEIGEGKYWDGAVLANTPLEPVIDLAGGDDVDILVVMMTLWNADPDALRVQNRQVPQDLPQALSLTLDWALLASYRVAFEAIGYRNRLAAAAARLELAGLPLDGPVPRPISTPTVIAPQSLMPLDWIIDYEEANHETLFAMGHSDAERALSDRTA
jgi:NTE family protein